MFVMSDNKKSMRKYLLPIFAIAITGLIGSCTKSYSPTTGPYQNLQIALQTIATAEITTTVDATTGGTFYGNSGTRYVIPRNAFQTSGGTQVTGNVTVLTAEFLSKTDMIFSGIIPYSLLGNLATAGEIYILPAQNASTLNFTTDIRYQAIMPQQKTNYELDSLSLFYGRQDPVSQTVSWLSNPSQPGSVAVTSGDSVTINGSATGFVSAGEFIDVSNSQYPTFTVTPSVTGAKITDTVAAFVVYDGYNSIWLMQNVNEANHVFTESKVRPIPFHLVLMTVINGYFYGGIVAVSQVSNGANYTVNMIQIAPSDFKTMVGNLP